METVERIPDDIADTAQELARRITSPTVVERLGEILSPAERIAYALLAERERAAKIADMWANRDTGFEIARAIRDETN